MTHRINPSLLAAILVFLVGGCLGSFAVAGTVYDEGADGELPSYLDTNPDPKDIGTFANGSNVVKGVCGDDGSNNDDGDLFTFEIPTGHELTAINLTYQLLNQNSNEPGGGSYIAIQGGTTIGTSLATVNENLSNALVKINGDLLPIFAAGPAFGGTGLTAPLASGKYSMFVHETSAEVTYEMDFRVSPVPEPSTLLLGSLGGLLGYCRRPRRGRGNRRRFL